MAQGAPCRCVVRRVARCKVPGRRMLSYHAMQSTGSGGEWLLSSQSTPILSAGNFDYDPAASKPCGSSQLPVKKKHLLASSSLHPNKSCIPTKRWVRR